MFTVFRGKHSKWTTLCPDASAIQASSSSQCQAPQDQSGGRQGMLTTGDALPAAFILDCSFKLASPRMDRGQSGSVAKRPESPAVKDTVCLRWSKLESGQSGHCEHGLLFCQRVINV